MLSPANVVEPSVVQLAPPSDDRDVAAFTNLCASYSIMKRAEEKLKPGLVLRDPRDASGKTTMENPYLRIYNQAFDRHCALLERLTKRGKKKPRAVRVIAPQRQSQRMTIQ